jgi:hypothetical protein
MDKSKIIILITGTNIEPYNSNWEECNSTWIPELRKLGYNVMIALGDDYLEVNHKIDGDIIWFNAEASKYGLFEKSVKLPIKWILEETNYEYYFRIDSDSFVEPKRFDLMLKQNFKEYPHLDYMGCAHPYLGWNPNEFGRCFILKEGIIASGCAYFISKRAMQVALRTMVITNVDDLKIDDWVLGRAMWENGIPLLHDSRILFESKYKTLSDDPYGVGMPDIEEPNSHLSIQHYMNGHMEEAMIKLGYRNK